jgi:pyruvate formate lyase activating enzyme
MKPIQIGGLTPFTTIDYPGKLAAVLFLRGCPIRCIYCSNPHLLEIGEGEYDPDKIIQWLQNRIGKLEAVVFSGGEALMQGDIAINYMKQVKQLGFLIGLHTNGFYPEILKRALDVVNWLGLDFKATRDNYAKLAGVDIAYDRMLKSLDIWLASGIDGEVRITCDPRFVTKNDLLDIAKLLSVRGVGKIAIQKYIPHFESDNNKTTEEQRSQFFNDEELKKKIDAMFNTVFLRE